MEVMRDLRRGPEGELVVRAVGRDRAVRLDRRVRVPLEEEPVVAHMVGARKARIEVAEREVNLFEDVRTATLFMDLHVLALERLLDGEDRLEVVVLDIDQREGLERRVLIDRRDSRDGLADVSDAIDGEGGLVLRRRHDPHLLGHVRPGHNGNDPGMREGAGNVDPADARVRPGRTQETSIEHPREEEVVGISGLAGEMGPRVGLRQPSADYRELAHVRAAFSTAS